MEWNAKWIWDYGEEKPRNYYLCFRKVFELKDEIKSALFNITADSRYVLYINGERCGNGSVRSWPFKQFYDTYDIKDKLKKGKNLIAVLVIHYGVSSFQYIEGRGGLIGQADIANYKGEHIVIGTDSSWKNKVHNSYRRNVPRISCQQTWTEIYNADLFSDNWNEIGYDDSSWTSSRIIGDAGINPWSELIKRDIPYMREDTIYPERVESLKTVKPIGKNISIDMRPMFFENDYDANQKNFLGYICSIIEAPKQTKVKINFLWTFRCNIKVNDKVYHIDNDKESAEFMLEKGKNLFLIDVSGRYHDMFIHMNFEYEGDITFKAPGNENEEFVAIGPFEKNTILDIGVKQDYSLDMQNEKYKSVWNSLNENDIMKFSSYISYVDEYFICHDNVFNECVHKNTIDDKDVTYDFQNMIIPNETYSIIEPDEKGDTEIIVDFGKEMSGFIEFEADVPKNVVFDFYGVECVKNGEAENTEALMNTMRYISKEGRQKYRSVIRRGFRYLNITVRNFDRPIKFYKVFVYKNTYPVAEVGRFKCSDYIMNKIWDISKYTTELCMEDTFVDCPAYEQTFWVGDSRNESLINYYTFGAYDIAKRCMKLVGESLKRTSIPESQVPSGWQNVLTAWALFWVSACKEYYEYTHDVQFIKDIYPKLVETIKSFGKHINSNGLFEINAWNMLDWAPMDTPNSGVVTHQNAELYKAILDVSKIADVLNDKKEKIYLEETAMKLKNAINKYLWCEEKQAYYDCIYENGTASNVYSMQTNTMAYLSGCADGERKEIIEKYLIDAPHEFVKIGSPFMSFFYLEALYKCGKTKEAYEYMRDKWGLMLKYDASTCWETFPGFQKNCLTRSHCHAWSAAPGYFLSAYVLGIKPADIGFKKVKIDIKTSGLEWAYGSIPVPQGRIDIKWQRVIDGLSIKINGPKDIQYVYDDRMDGLKVCSMNINEKNMI